MVFHGVFTRIACGVCVVHSEKPSVCVTLRKFVNNSKMKEREIRMSLDEARDIYQSASEDLKKLLLTTFTEEELKRKSFDDINHIGYWVLEDGTVAKSSPKDDLVDCMDNWPTRKMAEAQLAMSQLAWWMRQPEYNGADQDEWCDWSNKYQYKATIKHYKGNADIFPDSTISSYLAFKCEKTARRFLEDHRELIEKAKPLL